MSEYAAAPMPRFRLLSRDGHDLGVFHAADGQWGAGDRIERGGNEELIVERLVVAEPGDEVSGYLIVAAGSAMRAEAGE